MKVHILQHVWFEGLGIIQDWINEKEHNISYTKLYENDRFPQMNEFDFLIILGGPMSVNDTATHPWLVQEKTFIKTTIENNKPILGVCLGAQLIANVLGERVFKGSANEIGWFPVQFDTLSAEAAGMKFIPHKADVFHWHGETFNIPKGAVALASTIPYPNQAFLYNNNVLALQFHLEVTRASCLKMVNNMRKELVPSKWVQSEDDITNQVNVPRENIRLLKLMLEFITKK
jgi:GMP synthase-like glutamine amidotransferase